jgi:hypothetical protein
MCPNGLLVAQMGSTVQIRSINPYLSKYLKMKYLSDKTSEPAYQSVQIGNYTPKLYKCLEPLEL